MGVLWISSDGDDGGKNQNQKKFHAESPSLENYQKGLYFIRRTTWPGYAGTTPGLYHGSSGCFEYLKKIPT